MALDPLALLRMAVMRFPFVQSLSKDFNGNRVYSMYAVAVQRNPDLSGLHSFIMASRVTIHIKASPINQHDRMNDFFMSLVVQSS
jgi:hypothetical protein